MSVILNYKTLGKLQKIASKKQIREAITGIRIEDEKKTRHYIAMDGRILAVHSEKFKGEALTMPITFKCSKIKASAKSVECELVGMPQGFVFLKAQLPGEEVAGHIIDKNYPDWRICIPPADTPEVKEYVKFDVAYLKAAKDILKDISEITPKQFKSGGPCLFESGEWKVVLLPIRRQGEKV